MLIIKFLESFWVLKNFNFFSGPFRTIPREPTSFSDMKVWSQKTTALACQNFMLSMRAYGYDTCPLKDWIQQG